MKFFDKFTKWKMSFDAAGRHILTIAMINVKAFLKVTLPGIVDSLDIDLDTLDMDLLRADTIIVCLWATTKSLENDDHRLLDAIHRKFFAAIGEDRQNQLLFLESYRYRCTKYNKTWDAKSPVELGHDILCDMFNEGELDKDLLDPIAIHLLVPSLVTDIMKDVLEARNKIILPDT